MSKTELFVRKTAGGVFKVINEAVTTGSVFWVDSGSSTAADAGSNGKNPDKPFATLDYAVGKCADNNGDIIYVMPGHAETIATGTALTLDVAGIKVIGLGCGYSMPKFTLSAEASTVNITAANCHVENLWLYSTYTGGLIIGVTVGALADGLVLKDLVLEESANTTEFLIGVNVAAACHHVTIDGLKYYGIAGGSDTSCIVFAGASNFSVVKNCEIYGDFAGAAVDALGAASTYMTFLNNIVHNVDGSAGLLISVESTTTGIMSLNSGYSATNDVSFVGAAMAYFENYTTNALGAHQGRLLPVADS
jgi:hypothetical protein